MTFSSRYEKNKFFSKSIKQVFLSYRKYIILRDLVHGRQFFKITRASSDATEDGREIYKYSYLKYITYSRDVFTWWKIVVRKLNR